LSVHVTAEAVTYVGMRAVELLSANDVDRDDKLVMDAQDSNGVRCETVGAATVEHDAGAGWIRLDEHAPRTGADAVIPTGGEKQDQQQGGSEARHVLSGNRCRPPRRTLRIVR